jgi:hypothetical protein
VRIEFEMYASNFDHDPKKCDLIVCWEDNLPGYRVPRLALRPFAERASPPVIALPLRPKFPAKVWDEQSFLRDCPPGLRSCQERLLKWAKRHGKVILGRGPKIASWTFRLPLDKGDSCRLFGVYANGKVWPSGWKYLPRHRQARFEQCLRRAPEFKAGLASGKAWFEVKIQDKGVLQALRAAVLAAATAHSG